MSVVDVDQLRDLTDESHNRVELMTMKLSAGNQKLSRRRSSFSGAEQAPTGPVIADFCLVHATGPCRLLGSLASP